MSNFYNKNSQEYFDFTVNMDQESFLKVFADTIPEHSEIMDIGCGSGRDLLWLKEKGHHSLGLEKSEKLAGLAEKHSGCPVIIADLETYDFSGHQMDGIILVGSLVHIYHTNLKDVLERLIKALKPDGYMYLSLKEGKGYKIYGKDRVFYFWQDKELKKIYKELNLKIVDFSINESERFNEYRKSTTWLGYVLKISRPDV